MPTRHLEIPYILDSQAQKHVTHNEALDLFDAVVQLAAKDRAAPPPASPAEGDRYVVAAPATGAWAGREGDIAVAKGDGWIFIEPRSGWVCYVIADALALVFHEGVWTPLSRAASKILAWTNFDNYSAADAWTTIALNTAGLNDENDFNAASNLFTPPVAGLYVFHFALAWAPNGANLPTRLSARLRTGAVAGPFVTDLLLSGEVTLTDSTAIVLAAGETVVMQGRLTGADGYFKSGLSRLSAYLAG